MSDLVANLTAIADASRRQDGSDIPLGQQLREAASRISQQDAELDRMRRELANKEAYFSKCVSNEAFFDQDARRLRQIEKLEKQLSEARKQAFSEAEALIRVRLAIYATKEADADPFQEPHLNTWDKYQHTREAFEIAVEEINEAAAQGDQR